MPDSQRYPLHCYLGKNEEDAIGFLGWVLSISFIPGSTLCCINLQDTCKEKI